MGSGMPLLWLIVFLLWPVALLNYLDRQMMAAMKTSIMQDIPSIAVDSNWGLLLGYFKWVYAGLSPFGGMIADRFSRRWIIALSLFVWSAVTWLTGHCSTFNEMLVARALMGISEACYIPAALALITDFHSIKTRSRAVGIHQTAIYAGLILGGFSGYAADSPNIGWRMAYSAAGIVGMVYALPLLLLLRDAPHGNQEQPFVKQPVRNTLAELLSNPSFIILVAYFTVPAIAGWIVKDWMPVILKDRFSLSQGIAGMSAATYVNATAFAGAFLGGWLADIFMRRTVRGRIYVSAAGLLILVPALFGVGRAPTLVVAILFLALFGIGWGFFDCNNMPILSQIARPETRATGYGIMNLVSISIGGVADVVYGKWRELAYPDHVFFTIVAIGTLFCAFLVLFIKPKRELG